MSYEGFLASSYFGTRLGILGSANMDPTIQYDLASSNLTNGHLEQVAEGFGGAPAGQYGWGLAQGLGKLMTSQPQQVPVRDLKKLQVRLQAQGFLAPDYVPTGQWDPTSAAGLRLFDRQNAQQAMSGHSMGATTFQHALQILGWTLPSSVLQGVVGVAKGLITETPQVFARGGLAGGAAEGAAIGAVATSVFGPGAAIGAAVGGLIGGAFGFLSDLFGHQQGEAQNTDEWHKFLDALTPYDEYRQKGGFQSFMQDMGYVLSAGSMIAGAGAALPGLGALGGIVSADAPLEAALAQTGDSQVGWFTSQLGKLPGGLDRVGTLLKATRDTALVHDALGPAFTGLFQTQFVPRLVQNLGQGTEKSPMRQAIDSAPSFRTGITIPGVGLDITDIGAFVLAPTEWLPKVQIGGLSRGFQDMLGDTQLASIMHLAPPKSTALDGTPIPMSLGEKRDWAMSALGENDAERAASMMYLHLAHGTDQMAAEKIVGLDEDFSRLRSSGAYEAERHNIIGQVNDEIGANDFATTAAERYKALYYGREAPREGSILDQVLSYGVDGLNDGNPNKGMWKFSAYVGDQSLGDLKGFMSASKVADEATRQLQNGEFKGISVGKVDTTRALQVQYETSIRQLTQQQAALKRTAIAVGTGGSEAIDAANEAAGIEQRIKDLNEELKTLRQQGKVRQTVENSFVIPERIDTMTRKDLFDARSQFDKLREDVQNAYKAKDPAALTAAQEQMQALLQPIAEKGLINQKMLDQALSVKPTKAVSDQLLKVARTSAEEADLGPVNEQMRALGYKPVIVARDNLILRPDPNILKITGLADFTTRRALWETLGLGLTPASDKSLTSLRGMHLHNELDDFVSRNFPGSLRSVEEAASSADPAVAADVAKYPFDTWTNVDKSIHTYNDLKKAGATLPPWNEWHEARRDAAAEIRSGNVKTVTKTVTIPDRMNSRSILRRLYATLDERGSNAIVTQKSIDARLGLGTGEVSTEAPKLGNIMREVSGGHAKWALPAVSLRDLSRDDIGEAFRNMLTEPQIDDLYRTIRRGDALGAEMRFMHPIASARQVGEAMRVNGLVGFGDLMRTWHAQVDPFASDARLLEKASTKRFAATVAAGAGYGALTDPKDRVGGALKGALIGGGGGLAVNFLVKRSYGYLPDYLAHLNSALRFSLSPSFDVRRFVKQNLLLAPDQHLPFMTKASKYVMGREWISPFTGEAVTGERAWADAVKLMDMVQEGAMDRQLPSSLVEAEKVVRGLKGRMGHLDELDRTMYANGILGYNPMERQAAHALVLSQRGESLDQIRSTLSKVYHYGAGRTNLEKSINYIFFPFSFEKKVLQATGDMIFQVAGRNLLIHEGLKRWYASKYSAEFSKWAQDHLPLISQLGDFNAFSHGISMGQFLLDGLKDHPTAAGTAAQILGSAFLPGGAIENRMAQTAGGLADYTMHLFTPTVLTGESLTRMGMGNTHGADASQLFDMAKSYIPAISDISQMFTDIGDQWNVITNPSHETQYAQYRDYVTGKQQALHQFDGIAMALGYSDARGLLDSSNPAATYAQQTYAKEVDDLAAKYPDGASFTAHLTDYNTLEKLEIGDLLRQHAQGYTSAPEDAILELWAHQQSVQQLVSSSGLPKQVADAMMQQSARQYASRWQNNRRFNDLWNELFSEQFGPLRINA